MPVHCRHCESDQVVKPGKTRAMVNNAISTIRTPPGNGHFKRLALLMGKPVRAVLSGLGGSDPIWLPGGWSGNRPSLPDYLQEQRPDSGVRLGAVLK